MCTITLEYNQGNALARRKLADLLATGLFVKKDFQFEEAYKPTEEELGYHHQLRDAVLEQSRRTKAPIIARYL